MAHEDCFKATVDSVKLTLKTNLDIHKRLFSLTPFFSRPSFHCIQIRTVFCNLLSILGAELEIWQCLPPVSIAHTAVETEETKLCSNWHCPDAA